MPKMSDTMEEGVIATWLKKEGDEVKSGDILAEVDTDKATMELESYEDGILLYIGWMGTPRIQWWQPKLATAQMPLYLF